MPQPNTLSFPIRIVNGTLASVEQGSTDDTVSRLNVLLRTEPGHFTRTDELRDIGLYDQAHLQGGADLGEIQRQIDTWVPEANAVVEEDPSRLNEALEVVNVRMGV